MTTGPEPIDPMTLLRRHLESVRPADSSGQLADLLRRRARRLASPPAATEPVAPESSALCFRLGQETYGLPLGQLEEVLPLQRWTPVPGWPRGLLGVANRRGSLQPVLDLHTLLGLAEPASDNTGAYVLFLRGPRPLGARVDTLDRIRPLASGEAVPNPQAARNPFVTGITPDGLVMLDASRLFDLDFLRDQDSA